MYTHFKRCYVLLLDVELNYGSNVQQDVRSKDGVNQMNASVTTRLAGQLKKMEEARLSFEERKTIPSLNVYTFFGHPLYIQIHTYIYIIVRFFGAKFVNEGE